MSVGTRPMCRVPISLTLASGSGRGTEIVTRCRTREAMTKYINWKLGLGVEKPTPVLGVAA